MTTVLVFRPKHGDALEIIVVFRWHVLRATPGMSRNQEPTPPLAAPVEATEPRDPTQAAVDEPKDPPSAQPTDSLEAASTPKPAAADPAPKDVAPARPARLTVIVFPWGNVWMNGKRKGAAPLKNEP